MEEKDNLQNLQSDGISTTPTSPPEGSNTSAKFSKKKKLIVSGIAVIVVFAIAILFSVARGSVFEQIRKEAMKQFPLSNGTKGWVVSDDYIKVDTNPDNINPKKMTRVQYTTFEPVQKDSLGAIKFINEKLGFSGALYEKMMGTTALMGRQTEENDKYRVSWKYHPDNGLEVMYEKK